MEDPNGIVRYNDTTWRVRIATTKDDPTTYIWAISTHDHRSSVKIYYYAHGSKKQRAYKHDINLKSLPKELRTADGDFSTMAFHDLWKDHFRWRLQFAEMKEMSFTEFSQLVAGGEDPIDIARQLDQKAPNRTNNGRKRRGSAGQPRDTESTGVDEHHDEAWPDATWEASPWEEAATSDKAPEEEADTSTRAPLKPATQAWLDELLAPIEDLAAGREASRWE